VALCVKAPRRFVKAFARGERLYLFGHSIAPSWLRRSTASDDGKNLPKRDKADPAVRAGFI